MLRARQEAEEKARLEAELKAQEEALLKAQQEAAERARREAEIKEEEEERKRAEEERRREEETAQKAAQKSMQDAAAKPGKGKKKAARNVEEKVEMDAADVKDVNIGLPPTSVSPAVAARADAEDAFWAAVNGVQASGYAEAPAIGVPPGVTAPVPSPSFQPPFSQAVPMQSQISLPGQDSCPGCSAPLDAGSRFCGECGFRLESKIISCHLCGAPQEGDAKFCGECGSKLHDNKAHPAVPQMPTAQQADLSSYQNYLSGQKPSQAGWVAKLKKLSD